MIQNLIGPLKARAELSATRILSQVVVYVALGIAALFGVAAFFVWLARTESLLFALLVFAGAFLVMAIAARVYASVLEKRRLRLQQQSAARPAIGAALMANPALALTALRSLRVLRRAPMLSLGGAIVAGLALAFLGPYRNGSDEA